MSPTQRPNLPAPTPLDLADPFYAPEAVRRRIRRTWERRRAETATPPAIFRNGMEVEEWGADIRYLSADLRSHWPLPDDSPTPGYVPLSLRLLEVWP